MLSESEVQELRDLRYIKWNLSNGGTTVPLAWSEVNERWLYNRMLQLVRKDHED